MKLDKNQLKNLIDDTKAGGGNTDDLEGLLAEVEEEEGRSNPHPVVKGRDDRLAAAGEDLDAKLEEKREQAEKSEGECMICHEGPRTLYAGTCDSCFRDWMLSVLT